MQRFIHNLKNKNFLCLWLAQMISQFGDRITQMALIGLIAERYHLSAIHLAKLISFSIIPVFLLGPWAGVYVDRWDRRITLFVCDVMRGLLVLTIPFVFYYRESMIPIYIIVFLTFSLSRFYIPAKLSIIPDLVEKKDLLVANSLVTVSGMIAFVLGAAFGGVIVEQVGARDAFIWDAVTFFISGVLVFSIARPVSLRIDKDKLLNTGKEMISQMRQSVITELAEGVRYLIDHKEIRFVITMMFVLFSAAGAIYVVIIVFVQEAFQSVTQDFGFLSVFLGLGLIIGSLMYGRWGEKISRFKTMSLCLVFGGIMLTAFAMAIQNTRSFSLAALLSVILGMIVGPIFISANTIVHQVSHDQMRGKVFGAMEIVYHTAFLITMFLSSLVSKYVESFWIITTVGVVFACVGVIGLWHAKEHARQV